jgi:hypothetical protein
MAPLVTNKKQKAVSKKKTSTVKGSKSKLALTTRLMSPMITEERDEDASSHRGSVINVDGDTVIEAIEETDEEELGKHLMGSEQPTMLISDMAERLGKEWNRPVYAFFDAIPEIEYVDNRRCHAFRYGAKVCKNKTRYVRRFLDKKDAKSTSNMRKHAKNCWGPDVIEAADEAKTADDVREITVKGTLQPSLITAAFERNGRGKVTYSHQQHTRAETRCAPFLVISD